MAASIVSAEPFLRFTAMVGAPIPIGPERRCIPILGGTVEGEFTGTILPGADWQTIAPDGTLDISARYILELEAGRVEVQSNGLRTASAEVLARMNAGETVPLSDYYFRTAMRFFTAIPALDALNRTLAVAIGERFPDRAVMHVYRVL